MLRILRWNFCNLLLEVVVVLVVGVVVASAAAANDKLEDYSGESVKLSISKAVEKVKLELWSRGAFSFEHLERACQRHKHNGNGDDNNNNNNNNDDDDDDNEQCRRTLQMHASNQPWLGQEVRKVRWDWIQQTHQLRETTTKRTTTILSSCHETFPTWICQATSRIRGGDMNDGAMTASREYQNKLQQTIRTLGEQFGPDFLHAIDLNQRDHDEDCRKSCEIFYCAPPPPPPPNNSSQSGVIVPSLEDLLQQNQTTIASLSMGAVPPEDFADLFGFPLDLMKVTQNVPLFSKEEAARVIETAEAEGVAGNEFNSGKYRLGGDWLDNLPKTREWFNQRLQSTFFPLLTHLFPEIVSSPSILRAHSVSLLKYNASHPRTDVHIDNGILAMTLAMTPRSDYVGGGTFFEHMGVDHVLQMDVGHGTFRPGSVRHGGHRVTAGTRYILGAFLLLEDKVEHVRRMKNRGSALRRKGDLDGAARHFEWALALNPKCTTCLKDWAEILLTQKKFVQAEQKIRTALELLENNDSDALFTLGVLLSEQGRDDESIKAYMQSVELNAEDAELCFNLGVKFGAKGKVKEEMEMYEKALQANPKFGPAWNNYGTALAENGNLEEAEIKFLSALECGADVAAKAFLNLALLYHSKANSFALANNLSAAKANALQASEYVDRSKQLLDQLAVVDDEIRKYLAQFKPLRLQCHRILGQIYAGLGDLGSCEQEFRAATVTFPDDAGAWQMLKRALELQGKTEEVAEVMDKIKSLLAFY